MASANDLTELATNLAQLAQCLADRGQEPVPESPRPMPERVMLTAEEAAERLCIGRTLMYELIRCGEIESVRIGKLRRIPASAIQDYAARLVSGASTSHAA